MGPLWEFHVSRNGGGIEKNYNDIDIVLLNMKTDSQKASSISEAVNKSADNKRFRIINLISILKNKEYEIKRGSRRKFWRTWTVIGYAKDYNQAVENVGQERIDKFLYLDKTFDINQINNELLTGVDILPFEKLDNKNVDELIYICPSHRLEQIKDDLESRGIFSFFGQHSLKEKRRLVLFDDLSIDERTIRFVKSEYGENVYTCTGNEDDQVSYEELKNNKENYLVMLVTESRYADQELRLKKKWHNRLCHV